MPRLRHLLAPALLAPLPLFAQEGGNSILVLDASGSMWGQIDGKAKITIAQEVIGGLLETLPEDRALGLTVYGHRRKGDCRDIETLVAPAGRNRAAISEAVAAIKPKGKTPMTDAVIAAAEALHHSEEAATVILVSDGIETCAPDPCAAAQALEEAGVDFTAHVIGFDVADPEAQAQLACIAGNTGGRYLTASDAAELAEALSEVTTAQAPDPALSAPVRLTARERFGEATRDVAVIWTVTGLDGEIVEDGLADSDGLQLAPGRYRATAMRLSDDSELAQTLEVTETGGALTLTFEAPLPRATLDAPATGAAGTMIEVAWTGPDGEMDYLATALPGADATDYLSYDYTRTGSPMALRLPAQPGAYEIRYVDSGTLQVLARRPVTVTPQQDGLSAPDTAPIGATIEVAWQGGGFDADYIDVALPGAAPLDYLTYAYVRDGNPLDLVLPLAPGAYEIRYITAQDNSVAARQSITVTDLAATLDAPESAAAGATLMVGWEGPGYAGDYLTIAQPGSDALSYESYAYTRNGMPAVLATPDTPGRYVLRYVAEGRHSRVLAERTLELR
ncbi:VWA domain-containing protein [Salipiger sp. P9]|uniref:VWA domain-containing protein n=1 Tax=Salipiger pentaromativorans TaxID=2943193 RepID=UPI002157E403|nr:VWA domain-containing protein [Salipiger pentaromativorans]MCR8547256.1 VWA domain-containing protein [Salipiger pentaromativorans]